MKSAFFESLQKQFSKPKESKLFLSIVPGFKEKRVRAFTTLTLTLVTIMFFGLFAISPTLGTITDLQKQIDDTTFVHQSLQTKIANLTSLQEKYTTIQGQLPALYAVIPQTPSLDILVGQLHSLADTAQVQITRIQTFPVDLLPTPKSKYLSYAFTIEAQGTYTGLQGYVASLGTFNRLVTFDTISITHTGHDTDTYRLNTRGSAYFQQ